MEMMYDVNGKVVGRSRNLRMIVRAFGQYIIKAIKADKIGNGEGKLLVLFENGYNYETNFADFGVLVDFLHNRRNLRGVVAQIDGKDTVLGRNPNAG